MKKLVRFGLVGYGLFGAHHARLIAATPGARLTAIAVISEASREAARAAHPDAAVFADYRQLIEYDDVDVVSVVVPNYLHFEVARAALQMGKHVLVEKPMALELRHCDELLALADANKRILAVGHELRLSSLWGGAKRLVASGTIGVPQYVLVELSRFPYRQGSAGWRYDIERVGSWILEEPIHFFDLACWYMAEHGEPVSLYARANSRDESHPELKHNLSAFINFQGGQYALVSQTLAAFGHHQMAKIAGTLGTIWASWSAADARASQSTYSLRYGLGNHATEMTLEKPAGELLELEDEIVAMVRSVRDGIPPPCTGRDGRRATMLCLAAEESVSTGKIVGLERFSASSSP